MLPLATPLSRIEPPGSLSPQTERRMSYTRRVKEACRFHCPARAAATSKTPTSMSCDLMIVEGPGRPSAQLEFRSTDRQRSKPSLPTILATQPKARWPGRAAAMHGSPSTQVTAKCSLPMSVETRQALVRSMRLVRPIEAQAGLLPALQMVRVTPVTRISPSPKTGLSAVLYIDFDDSGPATLFSHRFARSLDLGATWTDEVLQTMDPGPLANAASGFLWGDYEGLTVAGGTFYGVFTGQSIGRAVGQRGPIFFKGDSGRQPSRQYAVKFVCGKPNTPVTAPGQYFTRSMCTTRPASLRHSRKKLRSLLPEEKAGRVTQLFDVKLGPDEALEIDCPDILKHARARDFFKGFVVI